MFNAQAQQVSPKQIKALENQIEVQAQTFKAELEEDPSYEWGGESWVEFTLDTFRIERLMYESMELDYSTAGMLEASYRAELQYDGLLNKYYKRLMAKLSEEDKKILRQSQRNWIAFRDSERDLNVLLSEERYSGGGTIQSLFVAGRSLDIVQRRVFELYAYFERVRGW
jgi:uncharacterized protein YecT (DUF1311 family)